MPTFTGEVLVRAFRILDDPAAKTALREAGGLPAMIASDSFCHEVIALGTGLHAGAYRQITFGPGAAPDWSAGGLSVY